MRKKFTSALLTACLVLGLALPARAASQPQQEEAIQVVNALGIMVGDTNGNMNLSSRVTRAEFITMAVKATPGGEQIGQAATSPYPDVPRSHWASGYVEAGVAAGLVSGYTDGTFRPNREISLAEGVTIALQLLARYPDCLHLWHMTAADYAQCRSEVRLSEKSRALLRNCAGTVLAPAAEAVGHSGCDGYQELLLSQLQADLMET